MKKLQLYLVWFLFDPLFFFGMLALILGSLLTVSYVLGLLYVRLFA